MIYLVTYDLNKPGQNYSGLYKAIKSYGDWWHYLDSTWLLNTESSAKQISQSLLSHIDQNDHILIIGITKEFDGWLPQKAWDWVNSRIRNAA